MPPEGEQGQAQLPGRFGMCWLADQYALKRVYSLEKPACLYQCTAQGMQPLGIMGAGQHGLLEVLHCILEAVFRQVA